MLAPYRCVVTGSHPEYVSKEMLDAFDAYQRGGGRHAYLGGNGFYWRIAFHPTRPHAIEVRRGQVGLRTWEGEAGEGCLAFTGEPSGLWRANGRPPQRLVGVGFDAQVFDRSAPYRRLPASRDPRVSFVFDGVDEEVIGDFGLRNGGAAGIEVDRADATLGSPPHLMLLATSDRLGTGGIPAPEEFRTLHRGIMGDQNARVRADMVFFPTAAGGAVFATGSIAWVSALPHNGYANNVARLTGNVIRRFLDDAPFEGFESMPRLTPIATDVPWVRLEAAEEDWAQEDQANLARWMEQLLIIRRFEERILELHGDGLIHGPAHASIGQEAGAVGAMSRLRAHDGINGTHRAHHQILAKLLNTAQPEGYDPRRDAMPEEASVLVRRAMAEIMGLTEGFCGGRGGSMHMRWGEAGIIGSSAIIGANVPHAVGYALSDKVLGRDGISVAFFGDGTLMAGPVYEFDQPRRALHASRHLLPREQLLRRLHPCAGADAGDAALLTRAHARRARGGVRRDGCGGHAARDGLGHRAHPRRGRAGADRGGVLPLPAPVRSPRRQRARLPRQGGGGGMARARSRHGHA